MDASWKCQANKENWKSPVIGPFPLELTCYERYSKNRRKLQFSLLRSSWFFLLSIKIAQLVSDIKQHHMTNTYHNDYGCWRFSVQSIDSFIHSRAFARESVFLYNIHAEKTERWYIMCRKTVVEYLYVHTLLYVCRNASCRIVCKVVSMTQTNTALVFFLPEWNTFGIHLWNR